MRSHQKILLLAVFVATFFVNNWVIWPDIMECRNLVTAREMVYDGHWLVPTMNGDLRLEKPPLPTWIVAVVERYSPDDIVMQRAASGVAALLLIFFVWRLAKRVLRTDPVVPTLLLCTCYNLILMGRTATWDIYTHAFMMGAIYELAMALSTDGRQWRRLVVAGVWMGLSLMSKGPVSLYALFLPFVIAFAAVRRPSLRGKWLPIIIMVVIALAVGGWWYAYVYLFHADALSATVGKESGSWLNHNVRPWYYYWKFFLETGVWSLLLLTALIWPALRRECRRDRGWMTCLWWTLAVLVLLSLLPEKKSRYLLPILIPASLTMGYLIRYWCGAFGQAASRPSDRVVFRVNAFLVAIALIAVPVAAYLFLYKNGLIPGSLWAAWAVAVVGVAAYVGRAAVRYRPAGLIYGVTAAFVLTECMVLPYADPLINNPEPHSIRATRTMPALEGLPFHRNSAQTMRIEIAYEAGQKITPIDLTDSAAVVRALPCVLVTKSHASDELSPQLLQYLDTLYIDYYDDNRVARGHRRYDPHEFCHHVTVVRVKSEQ